MNRLFGFYRKRGFYETTQFFAQTLSQIRNNDFLFYHNFHNLIDFLRMPREFENYRKFRQKFFAGIQFDFRRKIGLRTGRFVANFRAIFRKCRNRRCAKSIAKFRFIANHRHEKNRRRIERAAFFPIASDDSKKIRKSI